MRSLAAPRSDLCAPSATGTSRRPAISRSVIALRVAIRVGTLPYMVVRPSTSTSALALKAARIAIESSARQPGEPPLDACTRAPPSVCNTTPTTTPSAHPRPGRCR